MTKNAADLYVGHIYWSRSCSRQAFCCNHLIASSEEQEWLFSESMGVLATWDPPGWQVRNVTGTFANKLSCLWCVTKAIMSRGHPRLLLLLLLYVLIDLDSIKQKHGKWCLLSLLPQSNYAQFTHLWKRANLFNILRQKYTGKCSKKTKTEILYWPQDTSLTLQSTFFSPDWLHSMDDISIVPTGLELASVVITFKLCFNMIFMSPV